MNYEQVYRRERLELTFRNNFINQVHVFKLSDSCTWGDRRSVESDSHFENHFLILPRPRLSVNVVIIITCRLLVTDLHELGRSCIILMTVINSQQNYGRR
ncbi:hypothetical protein PUN28_004298 [Cardiocondyla obscurior]|uniref:Uncharacterized protein n=1 Tax=Cardiocondyla obscurior TaxID=286306 RepID=A0AAW2GBP6_9HYME